MYVVLLLSIMRDDYINFKLFSTVMDPNFLRHTFFAIISLLHSRNEKKHDWYRGNLES